MDKYIYDENNGLQYELQDDYYFPCFTQPAEKERPIGLGGSVICGIWKNTTELHTPFFLLAASSIPTLRRQQTGTGYHGTVEGRKCFRMDTENK